MALYIQQYLDECGLMIDLILQLPAIVAAGGTVFVDPEPLVQKHQPRLDECQIQQVHQVAAVVGRHPRGRVGPGLVGERGSQRYAPRVVAVRECDEKQPRYVGAT